MGTRAWWRQLVCKPVRYHVIPNSKTVSLFEQQSESKASSHMGDRSHGNHVNGHTIALNGDDQQRTEDDSDLDSPDLTYIIVNFTARVRLSTVRSIQMLDLNLVPCPQLNGFKAKNYHFWMQHHPQHCIIIAPQSQAAICWSGLAHQYLAKRLLSNAEWQFHVIRTASTARMPFTVIVYASPDRIWRC